MKRFDAGQAPCARVSTLGSALPSVSYARLESRIVCLRNEEPYPFKVGCGRWTESLKLRIWGCGQCPHFGPRTGPYWGRIGPDSLCFAEFPMIAGAGMQFESHLGYALPHVRGVLLLMC